MRLTARVDRVHRSASRLNPGDEITITYEHYRPPRGWSGPRPIPVLAKGAGYPAYLSWDSEANLYRPAARGWSFETAPSSP
ncbi:hypothetical protein [Spirochaeta lutea]|uniref:Uncharacterized protein n=1 Tax=Spirochaeta lutea TaxID=1480694 RepID=A0A098QSK6_9SPIO|nr:hypothetical protein [Spirochaeta lutea]KGE70815.1 hypothetical protein DC28_15130 [Spirochaeta lutea]